MTAGRHVTVDPGATTGGDFAGHVLRRLGRARRRRRVIVACGVAATVVLACTLPFVLPPAVVAPAGIEIRDIVAALLLAALAGLGWMRS